MGVHEPQGASLVAGTMIYGQARGGSRSHMAAALFVMAGPMRPRHHRDWARLKRVEPMAATTGPTTTYTLSRGHRKRDHGNATFYLVNDPVGNAGQPLCMALLC
jgi:hypothetical protein